MPPPGLTVSVVPVANSTGITGVSRASVSEKPTQIEGVVADEYLNRVRRTIFPSRGQNFPATIAALSLSPVSVVMARMPPDSSTVVAKEPSLTDVKPRPLPRPSPATSCAVPHATLS